MDPIALPQGASPDCSDVSFLPGGVSSRPPFQKIFANPVYPNHTMVYGKSFVDPTGEIRNLYAYSNGGMTVESPQTTPGVETALLDDNGNPVFLPAGSLVKSITAFGKEWIAPSDGLHGTDIALHYDGTYLDRVTQDGPGAPPTIANLALPSVALANTGGSDPTFTIAAIYPNSGGGPIFNTLVIYGTGVTTITIGSSVTVSGTTGSAFVGTYPVIGYSTDGGVIVSAYSPPGTPAYTPGSPTGTLTENITGSSLIRQANVVTAQTTSAHQLRPGYQVQISGVPAGAIGGGIASIVINNEQNPGIATVTTASAHGLVPGQNTNVSITGVQPATVGTSISSIVRAAQVVTVVMSASTGLAPGAIVTISGVTPGSFNGIWQVLNVTTTSNPGDTFTYAQVDVDVSGSGGSTAVNWPVPDTPTPTFFNVISAPTATTFQIALNYADGTWTTGTVTFAWDGTFYVQSVPSSTTFTYQQYGPDDTATYSSGQTATPYGQVAPGQHQMQVFFINRDGYTTAPSPPVLFNANGGQYLSVSNIPIGPDNVIARAVAFTGAQGAYFFYIPNPPQVNGQLVGTSTVLNDNTTTSAIFDFGDPSLLSALGISISGNNLANQVVIDGALGFGFYGSRLFTYGQRNTIQNLLNMGFEGGYQGVSATTLQVGQSYRIVFVGTTNFTALGAASNTVGVTFTAGGLGTGTGVVAANPNYPLGWTGGTGGALIAGHYGPGWQTSGTALTQSMYEDYSGAPIANANDLYTFRAWLSGAGTVTATISSASTSFSSTVTLTASAAGFLQGNFSLAMPATIPSDMILGITGSGIVVDEMSIIFAASPFLLGMFASYANNPEGIDGVSGVIGPEDDTHQVMDAWILRDYLYMLTQDPSGRLHQTSQGLTEPADWVVSEVAANCGAVSAYCTTRSQADDSSAAGGEEFAAWFSSTGIRIFGGQEPFKISQEIQRPIGQQFPGAPGDLGLLNTAAQLTVWGLNDPQSKTMWWGIPNGEASAPNQIWALSYLGLDSAEQIASSPPIHRSLSGNMVANDLARKWTPWQRAMNGAALMYRNGTDIQPVFFAGNGAFPNRVGGGYSNGYVLNPNQYTDDDYGIFLPYYTTAAFPDKQEEQVLGLGGGFKMLSWLRAMFYGVGFMNTTILVNYLNNPWPLTGQYLMSLTPLRGAPWGCGQATGDLFFVKFGSSPNAAGTTPHPGTDNSFSLSRLSVWMRKNARFLDPGVWP